ncbi:GIY-YIG nuclease family protein [Corynebacterium sanguinis]|uniref:GIY-YIG nuclease family protein n=1 Tax=Corynebacterium sanguinis TaxID=2594913 RepID=UPI0021A2CB25|nr:GIY-YIG nuclease family protein [Corynebacterium sanguinis]MCT2251700.1 GIY-YIG nuclease family protein [Corynebacterium sanguinis]
MSDNSVTSQLDALLANDPLGLLEKPEEPKPVTATDRLVRAFGEINEFYAEHEREPDPDSMAIAERKLGARLVGLRASEEKSATLTEYDEYGLLAPATAPASIDELLSSDPLGLGEVPDILDVSSLPARKSPADEGERAVRVKSSDFATFAQLFSDKHAALGEGTWALTPFAGETTIQEGRFFVINGVMCFVADVRRVNESRGEKKPRLRVIFENGTESAMYRESLANRLYETGGQALTRTTVAADEIGDADVETGHIYVLRSLSNHPDLLGLDNLYKIGFTSGSVEKRIAGAEKSATYLNAPVEVVADYRVYNVRPSALEHLLHRVFSSVRLDAAVVDEVGGHAAATEWFLVPLSVIDRAIEMIMSGDIVNYVYVPAVGELVPLSGAVE